MMEYTLNIIIPGFSSYQVIEIDNIMDLGDCYNIVWGNNEIFINKDGCVITEESITYKGDNIEIYIDRIDLDDEEIAA